MHDEVWFLDSSCSNHMTRNKEWFFEFKEGLCKTVKHGNNTTMIVVGKGSIRVRVNGFTQAISDVYFVLELKNNLLSLGQLQEKGLSILIQHGSCKIFHPKKGLIMHTDMKGNRMFYVIASTATKNLMCMQANTTSDQETHLWHCHFGHLNYKGLNTLTCKEMVIGLPPLKVQHRICGTCLIGKQQREPILKKCLWRASKQLQLIHADICDPITQSSNNNKRNILNCIDDFSRKTWIYFFCKRNLRR